MFIDIRYIEEFGLKYHIGLSELSTLLFALINTDMNNFYSYSLLDKYIILLESYLVKNNDNIDEVVAIFKNMDISYDLNYIICKIIKYLPIKYLLTIETDYVCKYVIDKIYINIRCYLYLIASNSNDIYVSLLYNYIIKGNNKDINYMYLIQRLALNKNYRNNKLIEIVKYIENIDKFYIFELYNSKNSLLLDYYKAFMDKFYLKYINTNNIFYRCFYRHQRYFSYFIKKKENTKFVQEPESYNLKTLVHYLDLTPNLYKYKIYDDNNIFYNNKYNYKFIKNIKKSLHNELLLYV